MLFNDHFKSNFFVHAIDHLYQRSARSIQAWIFRQRKIICAPDSNLLFIEQVHLHHIARLFEAKAKDIKTAHEVGNGSRRLYRDRLYAHNLAALMMSANTPDAVTSAPAPAPFTTIG